MPFHLEVCPICQRDFSREPVHLRPPVCPADGFPLVVSSCEVQIGAVKDRYKLLDVIGRGSTSLVYQARDQELDRPVAIKFLELHKVAPEQKERQLARFEKEARNVAKLDHQNIARFFEFAVTDSGFPYLVFEFIEGIPLSRLIGQQRRVPASVLGAVFSQVCDGLSHAHGRGVVHLDLKPNDIILTVVEGGVMQVKVIDFGKGAPLIHGDNRTIQRTEEGDIFGDLRYLSPEACCGRPSTTLSNVYSVGCMLYEALAGVPPFKGGHSMHTLMLKMAGVPEPLGSRLMENDFAMQLEGVIGKAMAKEPGARYATIDQLKDELGRWLPKDHVPYAEVERCVDHPELLSPSKRVLR